VEDAQPSPAQDIVHPEELHSSIRPTASPSIRPAVSPSTDHLLVGALTSDTATRHQVPPALDASGFSIDMIIQYVARRLGDIDDQIKGYMAEAEGRKAKADELHRFEEDVRAVLHHDTSGFKDDQQRADLNGKAMTALVAEQDDFKDNPALQAKLQQLHDEILSSSKVQSAQEALDYAKDQLTTLNSDNELTMMRLNSVVQLRSQVISSASNMQASINEGVKTVIGNMRA